MKKQFQKVSRIVSKICVKICRNLFFFSIILILTAGCLAAAIFFLFLSKSPNIDHAEPVAEFDFKRYKNFVSEWEKRQSLHEQALIKDYPDLFKRNIEE